MLSIKIIPFVCKTLKNVIPSYLYVEQQHILKIHCFDEKQTQQLLPDLCSIIVYLFAHLLSSRHDFSSMTSKRIALALKGFELLRISTESIFFCRFLRLASVLVHCPFPGQLQKIGQQLILVKRLYCIMQHTCNIYLASAYYVQ